MMIVLSIFTFVTVRKNSKKEAKSGGEILRMGLLAAVTNMKGTRLKMLKIKNSLDILKSKSKITQRTFRFLLFAIMAQAAAILLATKALTHFPNILKAAILSLFMFYVLNLFSNLRAIFTKYGIVKRLKSQINYFRANFVEELRVVNKYTFQISEEIENMELMQNNLYYERIMYEYESVFEKIDAKFWWILVMPLIIANLLSLMVHVWFQTTNLRENQAMLKNFDYYGKKLNGIYTSSSIHTPPGFTYTPVDKGNIFSCILGYFVLDTTSLETDMVYSQMLISLMLFMFAISRTYYLKKSSRIVPISEPLMK